MNLRLIPLWQKLLAGLAIVAALLALAYCQGRTDGKAGERVKIEQAKNKAAAKAPKAKDVAAEQRVLDALVNAKSERERNAIIAAAPGGVVSPADRAIACDRLRRAGYSGANLPAQC